MAGESLFIMLLSRAQKMERLGESTKEVDVQVAQERFYIYISYQVESLGFLSPHLQFVPYCLFTGQNQSNRCHCDTNFWATLSLAAGPPGRLLLPRGWVQSPRNSRDKGEMSQHLRESGPTVFHVFSREWTCYSH